MLPTPVTYRPGKRGMREWIPAAYRTVRRRLSFPSPAQAALAAASLGSPSSSGAPGTSGREGRASESTMLNSRNYNVAKTMSKPKKRKRLNRKLRKRQRKFARRVDRVVNGKKGSKSVTFNSSIALGTTSLDKTRYESICAYGNRSAGANGFQDLSVLAVNDGMTASTAKFYLKGFYGLVNISNPGSQAKIVDIYEWTNKTERALSSSLNTEFNTSLGNIVPATGYTAWDTSVVGVTDWQLTPYQNQHWLKEYAIVSKRTIYLAPGDYNQFEVKRGKPYFFDPVKKSDTQLLKPSFGYLFFVRGAPTAANYAAAIGVGEDVVIKYTRTYTYTRETAGANSEMDNATGVVP